MITVNNGRIAISGPMTLAVATRLLAEGTAAMTSPEAVFDLGAVSEIDSSGLAVVFAWLRAARSAGRKVSITNPPANLLSLADVYGVSDLLALN